MTKYRRYSVMAFKYVDLALWRLRGRNAHFKKGCLIYNPKGKSHGVELASHFPGWSYKLVYDARYRIHMLLYRLKMLCNKAIGGIRKSA